MRSDLLHVIAVYSNPIRWQSRRNVHQEFEQHMLDSGVRLTTIECAFWDRPYELEDHPHINRVRVRSASVVWNKENLQRIALSRIADDAKYIGFIDADIQFRKPGWASEAVHALQHWHVIQPWEHCYDLGPNDEHLQCHDAFMKLWWHGYPVARHGKKWWTWEGGPYRYAHCGFAWCWTREAIEWVGGLLEIAALGAGDHHMAHALVGEAHLSLPGWVSDSYRRHVMEWQERALRHVNFSLGFIPGTIEHHWHGRKGDRKYVDRWQIIERHKFDPDRDLKWNSHGVIELSGSKPMLARDLEKYFRNRNEDANTIE